MKRIIYVHLLLLFTFQITSANNNTSEKKVVAVRTTEKIDIDGKLEEKIWQTPGLTALEQEDPDQGQPPSQRTDIWVAYDDEAIYFAAKMYDTEPEKIFNRLVRRDFIWGDPSDGCVLYLDSYRDKRNGYFFYVSAAGTLADGLLENDNKQTDLTWDAVWEGVPYHDTFGWSVEMKIPYSQLRFKEGDSQVWGINVERFISRRVETDMLAYTPRNESGFASRFPDLVGIEGITPSARIETIPYVTGKAEYIANDQSNPLNSGEKYLPGIGLDVRAGLGNSLTLNATVNPDFGQVEIDPAIVNLTDVEHTFEEKRPFFTEGVSIYRFGRGGTNNNVNFNWNNPNIFYSRRIGRSPQGSLPQYDYADIPNGTHMLGAAKISGQVFDDWKIGTIHALTQRENADIFSDGQKSSVEIEPLTYYGVLRLQKDFNAGAQGLGILSTFTNRFFDYQDLRNNINKDAIVLAADGWTFLDEERTYVVTGWGSFSRVSGNKKQITSLQKSSGHYFQRPDADHIDVDTNITSLSGYAGRFMLNKNRGRFTFNTAVGFISPGFELNDLGYNSYSDHINTHFFASYQWREPTDFYQRAGMNAATYASFDYGGNKTSHGYFLSGYMVLPNLYGGNFSVFYRPESFNARRTRGGPLTINPVSRSYNLNLFTDNREWWVLNLDGSYDVGDDAESSNITATFEFKVASTLTLQVGPSFSRDIFNKQWIGAYTDSYANDTYGKRYVFAHLDQTTFSTDIRIDWILSPKLSFQVYLQPFISSGKYRAFSELKRPKTYDFMEYGTDGSSYEKIIDEGDISYRLDPDSDGPANPITVNNPDFNYLSLRGNAVLRWEYMPGSTLFLVWTQSREESESIGDFRFGRSFNNLFSVKPYNIFMLKITYWLGM